MTSHFITLGDGRKISVSRYAAAWQACLALSPRTPIGRGVDGCTAPVVRLRDLRDLPKPFLTTLALSLARDVDAGGDKREALESVMGAVRVRSNSGLER